VIGGHLTKLTKHSELSFYEALYLNQF